MKPTDLPSLHITLQPQGVAAPAQRIATFSANAVGTALRALDADNCDDPGEAGMGGQFGYRFTGLELTADERRTEFKNWVLANGFRDLARGVRETLEEAVFFLTVFGQPPKVTTKDAIDADFAKIRAAASKLNFPTLLDKVNGGLTEPMGFASEFLTLQKVRNCLEHRGGRVGSADVDPHTNSMTLNFPRLKAFYYRGADEVELAVGEVIDTHDASNPFGKAEVPIYIRRVTRSRDYAFDQPVVIEASDFFEIALACHMFAGDIAAKLPTRAIEAAGEVVEPAPSA